MTPGRKGSLSSKIIFWAWVLPFGSAAFSGPASLQGNLITIPQLNFEDRAYQVQLTVVQGSDPLAVQLSDAVEISPGTAADAATFDGATLHLPLIAVAGLNYWATFTLASAEPPLFTLVGAGPLSESPPPQCSRPEPDTSHGPDDPPLQDGFLVTPSFLVDGGPGPDGIPAIESPLFTQDHSQVDLQPEDLVIGVKIGDIVKAYPHRLMDYHEIVNDRFILDEGKRNFTLSYCPLTGSAVLWKSFPDSANTSFGVSGLLYNSNLVLYDRETGSLWSQMLEQSINGPQIGRVPEKFPVLETTWQSWRAMFPETLVLTIEEDESSFPYEFFPYGFYRTDDSVLYEVSDLSDRRLKRKERVVGINVGEASKVYPVSGFADGVGVINDRVGSMDVVAAGSSGGNFAVVFNRQLDDCTVLEFSPVQDRLPIVMSDNEGTEWDLFGNALNGPRAGARLQKPNSYIAYWFAWAAFFPGAEIHR